MSVTRKSFSIIVLITLVFFLPGYSGFARCDEKSMGKNVRIIYLHHSTGNGIWRGGVPGWFAQYNAENETNYQIIEQSFPSGKPYKRKNYPFYYWNSWVKHAGYKLYTE